MDELYKNVLDVWGRNILPSTALDIIGHLIISYALDTPEYENIYVEPELSNMCMYVSSWSTGWRADMFPEKATLHDIVQEIRSTMDEILVSNTKLPVRGTLRLLTSITDDSDARIWFRLVYMVNKNKESVDE